MPPVVAAIAAFVVSASAAVGVTVSVGVATFVATTAISLGISLGVGAVARALQRKKDTPQLATSLLHNGQGRLISVRQAAAPRRIIYGAVRVAGVLTLINGIGNANQYLLIVLTLAGHEIEEVDKVYMDGVELQLSGTGEGVPLDAAFASNIYIEKNLGLCGQTVFPSLPLDTLGGVDENFRQRGNAGVYIRLKFSEDLFPKGMPNFTFDVRGKSVFDPATDDVFDVTDATNATPIVIAALGHGFSDGDRVRVRDVEGNKGANGVWYVLPIDADHFSLYGSDGTGAYTAATGTCYRIRYSNNSALVAADFLTDPKYGFKARYDEEIDLTRLMAAANVCDEPIDLPTSPPTTEERYTANGMFETTDRRGQVLQQIQGSMAGWIYPAAGKWVILPGAYRLPGIELTEDDFIAPLKIRKSQSRRDLFNGVKGTFISPDHQWQSTDFPPVQDSAFVSKDGGIEYWKDVSLPFTTSHYRCQRIALIDLERQRRQVEIQAVCKMRMYKQLPGDTITITLSRLGWTDKTFEVLQMQLTPIQDASGNTALAISVKLRETDVEVYDFAVDEYGTLIPAALIQLPGIGSIAAPDDFSLTPTLGGDLRLVFPIPLDTEYKSGRLELLVDDEPNRVSTNLDGDVAEADVTITVESSVGFLVGDAVNFGSEICLIDGPGAKGETPSSNTWEVTRAMFLSIAAAAASNIPVYRLTPKTLTFTMPRNLAPERSTPDVSDAVQYHVEIFRPGRLRILYAALIMSNGRTQAPLIEAGFAVGFEPKVYGTLPGLRTAVGGLLTLKIDGPLEVGTDLAHMLVFPQGITIGPTYAAVPLGDEPTGGDVQFRINTMDAEGNLLFNGGTTGIPSGQTGSGTFSSGAAGGKMDDLAWQLEILDVGDASPGANLTVYVQY